MRVAIADDSALLREGVARALERTGFDVVASVPDGTALLAAVAASEPDVVVVDIRMPPSFTDEGVRAAQTIRRDHPSVGVVVLSQHVEAAVAMELLLHLPERVAYLLKDRVSDLEEFAATVRRVAEGGTALDPELVQPLIGHRRNRTALDGLTPPERQLLTLVVEGFANADIAARLGITERAARMRVDDVIAKLSVQASPDERRRVVALLAHLGA